MSNYGDNTTDKKIYKSEDVLAESFDDIVNALKVTTLNTPSYLAYESGVVYPGADADGYNVKDTGGRFTTVTTSYRTIIKNNDPAITITVYLNTDNANPIEIRPDGELDIPGLAISNIFIDTPATYASRVGITLFG